MSGCNSSSSDQTASQTTCEAGKDSMKYAMNLYRKVLPEHLEAYKASFEKCKVETLKEPGCLAYGMYQSYTDSTEFLIFEVWANKGAHNEHGKTAHLKQHIQEIKGMGDSSFKPNNVMVYICPNVN
jgi:quinol monooxygenase YgiN